MRPDLRASVWVSLIIVGVFVGALVWLWRSTRDAPAEPARPALRIPITPPRRAYVPPVPQARLVLPPSAEAFDARTHHTADPCTALGEPVIPATFEAITAVGITIAWEPAEAVYPNDAPLRPTSLAYAIAGILEEAAQLTGTERRQALTVIIDGTTEKLQQRTHAPSWVGGLYDGAAVHLGAQARADLGVTLTILRHELMHAQMHATIGCTPFWFNEGLATYFAGRVPVRELVAMMHGDPFDLDTLRAPAIFDASTDQAERMYAVSLAMVLTIVHRRGEAFLRDVVQVAHAAESVGAALDLWSRVQPGVGYDDVRETIAQKIFGTPTGPALDALVRGPLCCDHLRSPAALSCRAPGSEPPRIEACRKY